MNKDSRNYGIDLLRVVAMLGVIFLHVLGHGGVLATATSPIRFSVIWLWEILWLPAVNCFVLISGYVGYRQEQIYPKLKTFISLFFVVLFYSMSITILFKLIDPSSVSVSEVIKACMPIATKQYWFFTAYFCMFLVSPFLNLLIHHLQPKLAVIGIGIIAVISIFSVYNDAFSLVGGYTPLWFILVYTMGGAVRKYRLADMLTGWQWSLLVIGVLLITWLSKVLFQFSGVSFLQNRSSVLVSYVSVTILLMAVGSLCLFSKMKVGPRWCRVIHILSTSAFSVYLIHDNTLIRKHLISRISGLIGGYNIIILVLFVIVFAVGIFLVCIAIDKIRIALFRLIKIDCLAARIEKHLKTIINGAYKKVLGRRN